MRCGEGESSKFETKDTAPTNGSTCAFPRTNKMESRVDQKGHEKELAQCIEVE